MFILQIYSKSVAFAFKNNNEPKNELKKLTYEAVILYSMHRACCHVLFVG